MLAAVIVNESIQQIEQECGLSIDVNSLSYSRLLTHMKYLMARLRENETLTLDMEEYTKNAIPYSYQVAAHIIERLSRTLSPTVSSRVMAASAAATAYFRRRSPVMAQAVKRA